MVNALLVTLVLIVCVFINYWFGYTFTTQPIIVAPLVGLVLGDMHAGIICGATYELIFLGAVNIGGNRTFRCYKWSGYWYFIYYTYRYDC